MTPVAQLRAALRTRYQADYQPVCVGCGQLMMCILWRVFRCPGRVKVGRRWQDCPAPEQWERPNEQTRREVLDLLDQLERAIAGRDVRKFRVPPPARTRDLFEEVGA